MMVSVVPAVLTLVKGYSDNEVEIQWQAVWEDEDKAIALMKQLDAIQESISLMEEFSRRQRIELVGEVGVLMHELNMALSVSRDMAAFNKSCQELDLTLRKIVALPEWKELAMERAAGFEEAGERMREGGKPTVKDYTLFQPIFLGMAIVSIINVDGEFFENEKCSEEDCFCEEEEEESLAA